LPHAEGSLERLHAEQHATAPWDNNHIAPYPHLNLNLNSADLVEPDVAVLTALPWRA
jgi:hypothetical protein